MTDAIRKAGSIRAPRPGCAARAGRAVLFALAAAGVVSQALAQPTAGKQERPVMLVHVPEGACWQDMAFLAAVPAMTAAGDGSPALIALPAPEDIGREVADYLRRYGPDKVYLLGLPPGQDQPAGLGWPSQALRAESADAAACVLARTFWKSCEAAVLVGEDDYAGGLIASALAARLRAPLLLVGPGGLSAAASKALEATGAKRAVLVGPSAAAAAAPIRKSDIAVTELADAKAVLAWMRAQGVPVSYVAAANPTDRTGTAVRKLSLAAALLAAARQGMVVPLPYQVQWKVGFVGEELRGDPPKGIAAGKQPPRRGVIRLDAREVPFVVTSEPKDRRCRLHVDLNGDGAFDGAGEGPLAMSDTLALGAKRYVVTLGRANGTGKADVRLTWPSAEQVQRDLQAHYAALGQAPEHLCLVGLPDAIPQALIRENDSSPNDLLSDLPYTNADADLFAEVAVARLIAESAGAATLYASRVITYPKLLDDSWRLGVGEARWENTYSKLFENVGFRPSVRHDVQDLKWLVPPAEGVKGKRAREFDQDSPLRHTAAITHMAHSWWKDLGQTYTWDSPVLLSPVLVESGGCLTAALDREADFRSVIARLLRNGAVGFVGNSRPGIAHQEQLRLEFWNGVLAGRTIGQAHRASLNSMAVTVLDGNQVREGPDRYEMHIQTLFGDPAFAMHVPAAPRSAPARVTAEGDVVSIHAPATWWPVKIRVPEDWKKWAEKDLYVVRGAGTYPLQRWCGDGYDLETTCFNAELRTARRIKAIRQVQDPPKPLGWTGKHFADEHADGTRSYRWRVQLIDFDQIAGNIRGKVDRLDYRIEWEDIR